MGESGKDDQLGNVEAAKATMSSDTNWQRQEAMSLTCRVFEGCMPSTELVTSMADTILGWLVKND